MGREREEGRNYWDWERHEESAYPTTKVAKSQICRANQQAGEPMV